MRIILFILLFFSLQSQAQIIRANPLYRPFAAGTPCSSILDDYPLKVAISLNRLYCSYSGASIRVRRSSDDTESDIGFLSSGELDTATLKTFVGANSGYVTKGYNQGTGGSTYDATQTTAGNQPRIVDAGVVERNGGYVAMRLIDASSVAVGQYLSLTNWHADSDVYVYAFTVYTSNNVGFFPYVLGTNPADKAFLSLHNTVRQIYTGTIRSSNSVKVSAAQFTDGQMLLRTDLANRTIFETYKNGTSVISESDNNSNFSMPTNYMIGNNNTAVVTNDFYIFSMLLDNTDQSANRTAIEGILKTYFGL